MKGFYELNQMPGNAQVVVSNHTFIELEYRGTGAAKRLLDHKRSHAHKLGFDYMIATVKADNAKMRKLMTDHGYTELDQFLNHETENNIILYGIPVFR